MLFLLTMTSPSWDLAPILIQLLFSAANFIFQPSYHHISISFTLHYITCSRIISLCLLQQLWLILLIQWCHLCLILLTYFSQNSTNKLSLIGKRGIIYIYIPSFVGWGYLQKWAGTLAATSKSFVKASGHLKKMRNS